MDSIPCSVIYFWLIKSVRFFSLLCTVCQVHYLLTHKSSSVAKGKFPLCVQGLQLVHVTNPSTEELLHGGVAQHCRQRRTTEVVSLLSESERERAKLCSFPALSCSSPASLTSVWPQLILPSLASPPTTTLCSPPSSAFQWAPTAARPKRREVLEACDGIAVLSNLFSANASQKHPQSTASFRSIGQLSACRNPCPFSPPFRCFSQKAAHSYLGPRKQERHQSASVFCYGLHIWETQKNLCSPRCLQEQLGTSGLSTWHHSLALESLFGLTWCQQIFQTFCN